MLEKYLNHKYKFKKVFLMILFCLNPGHIYNVGGRGKDIHMLIYILYLK